MDTRGLLWGFISYALWGFFPLYWRLLADRSPIEILAHRMLWASVFYFLLFTLFTRHQFSRLFTQSRRDWLLSALVTAIICFNWGLYIYAVNSGHVLDSSLAYFINPLLNVAVGKILFKEPFPLFLKLAVAFAALGVLAKVALAPGFPWISLLLAASFCAYGIVKKVLKMPAMTSSVIEGSYALIPAFFGVLYFQSGGAPQASALTWLLFIGGGVVTGLPLFLFSFAAQRVPYSLMGMLQFISPSLQFLTGVLIFHEAFDLPQIASFGLIWIGIAFFLANQVFRLNRKRLRSSSRSASRAPQ